MLSFYQDIENLVMCIIPYTSRNVYIISSCVGNQQHSTNQTIFVSPESLIVWRSRKMSRKSLGVFARKRAVKVFLGQSVHF